MDEPIAVAAGLLCLVMVAMVATAAMAQRRHDRREQRRWQHWATRYGWTFATRPRVVWSGQVPGEVRLAVSGVVRNRRVTVAECAVTDAATNTTFFVAAVVVLPRPLPDTDVEPRGSVSRLLGTGAKTGRPDFDRAFRVRCAEPGWLPSTLIGAHMAGAVPSSWSVRGTDLVIVQRGRLDPDQVSRSVAQVLSLAEAMDPSGP
jgi:hypothetical protein